MKRWFSDFVTGMVIFILAVAGLVNSTTLDEGWFNEFLARPDVYMALILGLLLLLALLLVIRALRQRKVEEGQERQSTIWTSLPLWTVCILFVYLLILEKIGFILDSVWMLWLLTFLYSMNSDEADKDWSDWKIIMRETIKSGIFSVICCLVIYFIFTEVLSARLPVFALF